MLLKLTNIRKTYPGVVALDNVTFDLKPGEVHVLFGENGAGKSTLINVISGVVRHDGGSIEVNGREMKAMDTALARQSGIATVAQEFNLVPALTVAENVFLGRELKRNGLLRKAEMRARVAELLSSLGFDVSPDAVVGTLPRAKRQMVEIAKAMLIEASVLVLDEPTASLGDQDANRVLETVDMLRSRGVGIIYVSHRMNEIRRIANRITVLRNGRSIGTRNVEDVSEQLLVEMMSGRRIETLFPQIPHNPGGYMLEVSGLSTDDAVVSDVSINVRRSEIVGIAGLVGCGKGELGRALFGLEKIVAGSVKLGGAAIRPANPRTMLRAGVCYFPSDRVHDGLALPRSVIENASIPALDLQRYARYGAVRRKELHDAVDAAMKRLALRPYDLSIPVRNLSGGNKQKVLLARGLIREIDLFIFDEPTVGIDVGTKTEIYSFMGELVAQGASILLISSDMPEVLSLSTASM